ncbi:MAG: pyrroline-5-carboxylate reductase [Alphaproteobacteria bacterium]|nr:pyrroline-5-carboxylate reductase [Alphaproteobacteria bacterium]
MSLHLSVLGCGTMGRAVLGGLQATPEARAWTFEATVRHVASTERLSAELPHVAVGTDNLQAARAGDVVLLGVKPQQVGEVLGADGMPEALADTLVVSLLAGVTLATLERLCPRARFIRAMPNTPALIGQGMTVLSPGTHATPDDLVLAQRIFSSVGRCRILDEKHMDVVTALSGSGPAFACVVLEAMADGAVMMGLPRATALELAAQTLQGTAHMVLETGVHPAALRDRVTTPAGCTIAGLFRMEEGRVRSTIARTIQDAAVVAAGLGSDE